MRMLFRKVSGDTAKLAALDVRQKPVQCHPPLQHPLIVRQLGKTIFIRKRKTEKKKTGVLNMFSSSGHRL